MFRTIAFVAATAISGVPIFAQKQMKTVAVVNFVNSAGQPGLNYLKTALPESITWQTWERFFDPAEAMHALVAEHEGQVVGLVHYLFHRSTTRMHDVCYLQDLFTLQSMRGKGVGRHLIEAVYEAARQKGSNRVYWHTFDTNLPGRALYDKMTTYTGAIMYGYDIK